MPTGYTSDIYEDKEVTLRDFILRCARGMGALVMMRDDPLDAPIREFEPSDYHAKAIAATRARLDALADMRADEIERQAEGAHAKAFDLWRQRRDERLVLRDRYEAMLNEVKAWQPPTPDHEGLRKFMVEQLEESIRFDCSSKFDEPPVREPTGAWFTQQVQKAQHDLDYHVEENAKEVARTAERNAWVRALKESLPSAVPA